MAACQAEIGAASAMAAAAVVQMLKGTPEQVIEKLTWQRSGNNLQVTNPTPFYMNFYEVKVAGKKLNDVTYVAPMSTASFALPTGVSGGPLSWKIINDYGAVSKEQLASL